MGQFAIDWGSGGGDAFAFEPEVLLSVGEDARAAVEDATQATGEEQGGPGMDLLDAPIFRHVVALGPEELVGIARDLRAAGHRVEPNHVFFVHSDLSPTRHDCCCDDHPSVSNDPLYANPLKANPLKANPLKANPLKANPLKANPLKANPLKANIPVQNTAIPADPPGPPSASVPASSDVHVWILDTGLAVADSRLAETWPPAEVGPAPAGRIRPSLDDDEPDRVDNDPAVPPPPIAGGVIPPPVENPDGWLDPVAGHGTFVAGIVERLTPGCTLEVVGIIGPRGEVTVLDVVKALVGLKAEADAGDVDMQRVVVNLSFGGGLIDMEDPALLHDTIVRLHEADVTFVASAGNDSSCKRQFPAAWPEVLAVGALDGEVPAPFSNFGEWVDACADGVDLVSSFFGSFDGRWGELSWRDDQGALVAVDPDEFEGWARWSGTSFSAPVVVSTIVAHMTKHSVSGHAAVVRLSATGEWNTNPATPCLGIPIDFPPV